MSRISNILHFFLIILTCSSCGFYKSKLSGLSPESAAIILSEPIGYSRVNQYIFSTSCISCHSSTKLSGKVKLENYQEIKANINIIDKLTLKTHKMPVSPVPPLSSFQIELLSQWIKNGAPEDAIANGSNSQKTESSAMVNIRSEYESYVKPLIQKACMDCHDINAVPKGIGRLPIVKGIELKHIREATKALDFSQTFPNWSPQSSEPIYYLTALKGVIVNGTMPPTNYKLFHKLDGKILNHAENQIILNWIKNSMQILGSISTTPPTPKQYLETHCLGCHNSSKQSGGFKIGENGKTDTGIPFITPFEPENSAIYLVMLEDSVARKGLEEMPYGDEPSKLEQQLIYDWIKKGARKEDN